MRVGVGLKTSEIRLQTVEVDNRDRRLDLAERPPDLRVEEFQRPLCSVPHPSDPG
jgi:hypothetical protein